VKAGSVWPSWLSEIADEDWILASTDGFIAESLRGAGFEPRVVAITQDPVATHSLIARGLGLGFIPGLLAGDETGITTRSVSGGLRTRDVYALIPPGDRHPLVGEAISALTRAADKLGHER